MRGFTPGKAITSSLLSLLVGLSGVSKAAGFDNYIQARVVAPPPFGNFTVLPITLRH